MSVQLVTTWDELRALETEWNALAATPFHSWDWLATWWKHYGRAGRPRRDRHDDRANRRRVARQLYVLAVYDPAAEDTIGSRRLVGVAPWFLDRMLVKGNVVRWLGSGEVCTDHLSIICRPEDRTRVAASVAHALAHDLDDWDQLDLAGIDADNEACSSFVVELENRQCIASRRVADSCWVLELPAAWDDYLASISKSHRKQLRQLERRVIESGRTRWHRVESAEQLETAWPVLVDLHQRRRNSLGERGCFASQTFHDFHREVAGRLLERNQLRFSWLELDGTPAAAEYHFADRRLQEEPGRLSTILCLQRAIEEGHSRFDFLRGDEAYKAHWRAEPKPTFDCRIVPDRRLARIRGSVLNLTNTVTGWVRASTPQLAD
jgi:hypothetical protein